MAHEEGKYNSIYYICSKCRRESKEMVLSNVTYLPTKEDLKRHQNLEHIAGEVLICPCGKLNSWFDMIRIVK